MSNNLWKNNLQTASGGQSLQVSAVQNGREVTSFSEISIIENMASFLEQHGAVSVDEDVCRNMAATLSKRFNSSSPAGFGDDATNNSCVIGSRSPPAHQGRSVREFEEQMAALRKENFNLKLRLYFLEESIPGYHQQANSPDGQETFMKQLIDAKVEQEILRKEIEEKQEILKEAAQALNQMERIQKDTEAKSQAIADELNQQIKMLEMEKQMDSRSTGKNADDQRVHELEAKAEESERKLQDFQDQISKLDAILQQRDETIKEYEEKIQELVVQNADFLETLGSKENVVSAELLRAREELQEKKLVLADKTCMLQEAEEQLKNRTEIYEKACRTIQKLMLNIKNQKDEIRALRNNISSSTSMLRTDPANVSGNVLSGLECSSGLAHSMSATESNKENSTKDQQPSFTEADYLRVMERNKRLQKKLDALIQIGVDRNSEALIAQLRNDLQEARNEAEQAEKWRCECADVCSMLSQRLVALANFLNSLLKNEYVSDLVSANNRKAMRKAVNQSLDMSRSINRTLSITNLSMSNKSFLQMSNFSEIIDKFDDLENKTFNSHGELRATELDVLRSTENIKNERCSPTTQRCTDNQSESEAWSEPDRIVSMARIGLDKSSKKVAKISTTAAALPTLQTDSESEAQNENMCAKAMMTTRSQERIAQLEQQIAQRDDRILAIQCQLVDADSQLKKQQLKVIELTHELDRLRVGRNKECAVESRSDGNAKQVYECSQQQQQQIEEKTRTIEELQQERDRLLFETRIAGQQIAAARTEIESIKQNHEQALADARDKQQQKLEQLQSEYNEVLGTRLAEQQRLHAEALERDWISREIHEQIMQEVKKLEIELKEAQNRIEYVQENEQEMKQKLIDKDLELRDMKRQLDESTLQASQAVTERTRALSEKLKLEARVQELNAQLQQSQATIDVMQRQMEQLESTQRVLQQQLDEHNSRSSQIHDSDISQSGRASDDMLPPNGADYGFSADGPAPQRLHNSSPDLGIGSDAGRPRSEDLMSAEQFVRRKVNDDQLQGNNAATQAGEISSSSKEQLPALDNTTTHHDCAKVDQENLELRHKLVRTRRALENAYEKIQIYNQRKAQMEKDIRDQILETHNVLRQVRSNMEKDT